MIWQHRSERGPGVHYAGSAMIIVYGLGTLVNPAAWKEKPVYDFLDQTALWAISAIIIFCGAAWFIGAWTRLTCLRLGASLASLVIWSSFALNGFRADDAATVPYFCLGAAAGCIIAACRT
jgi:hypothetical protein